MNNDAEFSEKYPPQDEATGNPSDGEQARAAADAERTAAPIPAGAGGQYPPRGGPSVPLGGYGPPSPYQPYQPYPQYPQASAPGYHPYAPAPYPPSSNRGRQRVAPWVVVVGSLLVALAIVMAGCFIVAGVFEGMLWSSTPASATETHSFTVTGAPTVTLQLPAGNLHVVEGGNGSVTATLYKEVHAITHSAAQQVVDETTLATSQSGNDITLTARIPSFSDNFTSLQRDTDLTVSVPPTANLNLTVNAGNTDITGIDGALDVTMNAGNLTLHNVTAEGSSSLRLNAGNVDYRGAIAATGALDVSVDAGNARVRLPQSTPTHLAARTSAGNISVIGWSNGQGSTGTTTSHGGTVSVDLNSQPTNTLTMQVSFGDITVSPAA